MRCYRCQSHKGESGQSVSLQTDFFLHHLVWWTALTPKLHFSCIRPTHYFMLKEVQFLKEHCHLRRSDGINVLRTYTLFMYVYEESKSCAFHRSRFTVENDVCAEFEIHLQKYETFDTSLETHHGPV